MIQWQITKEALWRELSYLQQFSWNVKSKPDGKTFQILCLTV